MRRSRWRGQRTGFGVFVLGAGTGLITNLVTGNPEQWPPLVRPVATHAPMIGAVLLVAVAGKALWDMWHQVVLRPRWTGGNPYPGLLAYTGHWAGVYFGRTGEVHELLDRVRQARAVESRFVPVVGPSGSGKSSLVLAGLLPALRYGSGFRVLPPFTPGVNAVGELSLILGVDLVAAGEAALDAALAAVTRLRGSDRRVLLVVDQLEEAVTQCVADDRHAFLALLEAMLEREPRLRIVATLRSDTIGVFQQGPGRDLFRDPLMVNVMGPREIRLVVNEPARLTETTFDDGLADEIVRDTGGGDALPLLSYLLSDLYRQAGAGRHLSWSQYQASGGVSGAITRRAQAAVKEVGGADALTQCLDTLVLFVTLGAGGIATRQRVGRSSLDDEQCRVVQAFVEARLLVSDSVRHGERAETVYDIAHEALLRQWPPLAEHIQRNEESLRQLTELAPMARAWLRSGRQTDYLITGARLTDALAWARSDRALPAELLEFLDASRRNQAGEMERRADQAARAALASLAAEPEKAFVAAYGAYAEMAPTELAAYAVHSCLASGLIKVVSQDHAVLSLAYRGGRLATTAGENVLVWDQGATVLQTLPGHRDGATAVAYAQDGRLATADRDGALRVWTADGEMSHRSVFEHRITALTFATGGNVVAGFANGRVSILDGSGDAVEDVHLGSSPVYALAAARDSRLAAGQGDGTVTVWRPQRPDRGVWRGHTDSVYAVAFAPDGRLASGGRDATVLIRDSKGEIIGPPVIHRAAVNAVAFAADGRLASGGGDGTVRIADAHGRLLHWLAGHRSSVHALAFGADGRLVSGAANATVRIWDLGARLTATVADGVVCMASGPDGRLVTGSADGTVRAWAVGGQRSAVVQSHGPRVLALTVSPDGRLAAGCTDHVVRVWDSGQWHSGTPASLAGHGGAVTAVVFAPDGTLISGAGDGSLRVWSRDGECLRYLAGEGGGVRALGCAPDGTVLIGRSDGLMQADPDEFLLRALTRRASGVAFLALAVDGRRVVGYRDRTAHIWDSPDGRPRSLDTHAITAAAYAPNGRLAIGSATGDVEIQETGGTVLHTISDLPGPVTGLAYAADGRLISNCGGVLDIRPYGIEPSVLATLAAQRAKVYGLGRAASAPYAEGMTDAPATTR